MLVLFAYLAVIGFGYMLELLNLGHLRKHAATVPPDFQGLIDADRLAKVRAYTVEHTRVDLVRSLLHNTLFLVFVFILLPHYDAWVGGIDVSFTRKGLIFFMLLVYAEMLYTIPFDLYTIFRIENRYGFNTMTLRLWAMDFIKTFVISTILMGLLIAGALHILRHNPAFWWLWVWTFFLGVSLFVMYVSPYVIEPLFNKFSPLNNEELESGIRGLLQKVGLQVGKVFKMDASRRTRHTNAYFTGIGRVKRIVLYDTLISSMNREEIMAVLAHEAGHWKRKHLLKTLIFTELFALFVFWTSYQVIESDLLLRLFRMPAGSYFAKITLMGFFLSMAALPIGLLFNIMSRRHERQADRFSCELTGTPGSLISALIKLAKDNLANLHPHPLYALFHHSHPPIVERIATIRAFGATPDDKPGRQASPPA